MVYEIAWKISCACACWVPAFVKILQEVYDPSDKQPKPSGSETSHEDCGFLWRNLEPQRLTALRAREGSTTSVRNARVPGRCCKNSVLWIRGGSEEQG